MILFQEGKRYEPSTPRDQLTMFAVLLALIFARSPVLLIHGRVVAEEGTVYLQYAWNHPCLPALFATHLGYFSLCPNLFTILATRIVPLEWAALALCYFSLAVQLLTAFWAINCERFRSNKIRLLAAIICLFCATSREAWLNTINSQFYLLICTILILVSSGERLRLLRNSTLILAGLTGPVSCFLVPLFWVRYIRERSRGALLFAITISSAAIVQAFAIMTAHSTGTRALSHPLKYLAVGPAVVFKSVLSPFATVYSTAALSRILRPGFSLEIYVIMAVVAYVIAIAFALFLAWMFKLSEYDGKWLISAGLVSLAFNYVGSLGNFQGEITGGERYFFACNVSLALAILLMYQRSDLTVPAKKIFTTLLALSLLSALSDTTYRWHRYQMGPSWNKQVALWRQNPNHPIAVWPANWKGIRLDRRGK